MNSDYYLDEDNMNRGLPREKGGKVLNAWTVYSDEYAGKRIYMGDSRENRTYL